MWTVEGIKMFQTVLQPLYCRRVWVLRCDWTHDEFIYYHVDQFNFIWIVLTQNVQKAHCTWIHSDYRSLLVFHLETFVVHLSLCKYAGSACVTIADLQVVIVLGILL